MRLRSIRARATASAVVALLGRRLEDRIAAARAEHVQRTIRPALDRGDVAITDVVLPDENAFELLPRLRRQRPKLRRRTPGGGCKGRGSGLQGCRRYSSALPCAPLSAASEACSSTTRSSALPCFLLPQQRGTSSS